MKHSTLFYFLICAAAGTGTVFGADEQKDQVKVNGIIFNVAKDRRVEKVGGIYEPEGLDKYVDRRVGELSGRLERMESQLDETNRKLDALTSQLAVRSRLSEDSPVDSGPSPFKKKSASSQ